MTLSLHQMCIACQQCTQEQYTQQLKKLVNT